MLNEFSAANTVVLGVSKDSIKSHLDFAEKLNLNFALISDEDMELNKKYGVWQLKKMMGKEYYGTVRSSFIIDETGVLIKEYIKVKSKGHAQEVLDFIKDLGK